MSLGHSRCKPSAACLHLWRWVCGFPKRASAGTHHALQCGTVTATSKRNKTWITMPSNYGKKARKKERKRKKRLTRKLAPTRRDPVPEMVWTVILWGKRRPVWGKKEVWVMQKSYKSENTRTFFILCHSSGLHCQVPEPAEHKPCWNLPGLQ